MGELLAKMLGKVARRFRRVSGGVLGEVFGGG